MTDSTSYNVTQAHISARPGYCGGEPCIHGRRIKVRHVYVWYDWQGLSADEIASQYHLSLAQVHAALAYAYEHLDEIRQAIRQEEAEVAEYKKDHVSKLKPYLHDADE